MFWLMVVIYLLALSGIAVSYSLKGDWKRDVLFWGSIMVLIAAFAMAQAFVRAAG